MVKFIIFRFVNSFPRIMRCEGIFIFRIDLSKINNSHLMRSKLELGLNLECLGHL